MAAPRVSPRATVAGRNHIVTRRSPVRTVRNSEHPVKALLLRMSCGLRGVVPGGGSSSSSSRSTCSLDRFYLETDFSKGHLSEILRGKGSPSVTTLAKLAKGTGGRGAGLLRLPGTRVCDRAIELLQRLDRMSCAASSSPHGGFEKKS